MESTHKKGGLVPSLPSQTPRSSDRLARDARSYENCHSNSRIDRDKGVNVQVILRCRPLNDEETRVNTPLGITCNENRREVSALQSIGHKQIDKAFSFDKVFGPKSKQKDLFDKAIRSIVNEALEGYNCTIFAYGQTGTGKTYTMEGGGRKMKNGEFPSDAGVIPRSVRQICQLLEAQNAEYSMKVTFLELYNEEITDLLAPEESKFPDDKSKKPIALMEDGKGGVLVRGLEEEIVYSASEIYKILDKGSAKRRTAETLLNKQSSRSHSIFSITIHIKESTHEGEEVIRCGKLNLVDLAGSENIMRSGARDWRAREAGEINKSLLTLGRVINTLVDHSGHIPYRDSKLTRLLRDSLGGKTKTCIIATISPSMYCLEETLNTLEYAHRAKNIKNKPEVNQKMIKSVVMKDLYYEIDRLKQEVYAAREKNGVYIPGDQYLQEEAEKKAMTEMIECLKLDQESKGKQLLELQELFNSQKKLSAELSDQLGKAQRKLEYTEHALLDLEQRCRLAKATIKEKEFLIGNLQKSEKALVECAQDLRSKLENALADMSGLLSKIERKDKINDENRILVQKFHIQLSQHLDLLHDTVSASVKQQEKQLTEMEEGMQSFISTKSEATEELQVCIEKLKDIHGIGIRNMDDLAGQLAMNSGSTFEELNLQESTHSSSRENCFKVIADEADKLLNVLHSCISKQEDKLAAFAQQQREGHLRAVESSRYISKIAVDFFDKLDSHSSIVNAMLKERQTLQDQKLHELEKEFEDCTADEERQMLEKVSEMLAGSNERKKQLIQTEVDGLRENAADRTIELREGIDTANEFTSVVKEQWATYMTEAETNYCEDSAAIEAGIFSLEDGLHECIEKTRIGSQQWIDAHNSLLCLIQENITSIESSVRNAGETNKLLHAKVTSDALAVLNDVDVANGDLLCSIERSLKMEHDAFANLDSTIAPCHGELRELTSEHYHKTVEITDRAAKCLEYEYMVDEPTYLTPKKRPITLPTEASIEELRTPSFEELLKHFWESKCTSKQTHGDVKNLSESLESHALRPLRTSRVPLTAFS